ncbi:pentapeptide repeat-containing protein [Streptomyces sp. NPDC004129]
MTRPSPGSGGRTAQLRRIADRLRHRQQPTPTPEGTDPSPSAPPAPSGTASQSAGSSPAPAGGSESARWWTGLERSAALLVSVSTLAAAGFTWETIRQASSEQQLTRDGQVTDRYTAAVANLGDDAEEVRIGGLYALQRIAQDSPRDATTVVQVISAYIRSHAPLPKKGATGPAQPTNDVDAALSILTAPLVKNEAADLHGANLSGTDLTWADLNGADLTGADLNDANLTGANLSDANLTGANLTGELLNDANLTGANLSDANLTGANLSGELLNEADLTGAHLKGADLSGADLNGADLRGCCRSDLEGCVSNGSLDRVVADRWAHRSGAS